MKVLFTNNNLNIGGIETFMVRLAKNNIYNDIELNFFLFSKKANIGLLKDLEKNSNIYYLDDYLYIPSFLTHLPALLKLLFPLKKEKIQNELINNLDHVHAVNINSILFANRIKKLNNKVNYSIGVYHINEYKLIDFNKNYFGKTIIKLINSFSEKNILFFNEISRKEYSNNFKKEFENSIVAPIGVDLKQFENAFLSQKNKRIVSIGRLTEWKTYNYHMIDIIKKLSDEGETYYYDSYGDGIERKKLEQEVLDLGLENQIKFHNPVPYDKFKETIANSLFFIGAGTALIEASACGIPALIGIENQEKERPFTFGFLHELNDYSYQEKELEFVKKPILDYVKITYSLSDEEYKNLCLLAKKRAIDFDIQTTLVKFRELVENSKSTNIVLGYRETLMIVVSMLTNLVFHFNSKNYFNRL